MEIIVQDRIVLIDDEDYAFVAGRGLSIIPNGYVSIGRPYRGTNLVHRALMNPPHDMIVHHKDHNKLNNQKSNLQICTQAQNSYSRKTNKNSKFSRGIWLEGGVYRVRLTKDGYRCNVGTFSSLEEAEIQRDIWLIRLYGEFAYA